MRAAIRATAASEMACGTMITSTGVSVSVATAASRRTAGETDETDAGEEAAGATVDVDAHFKARRFRDRAPELSEWHARRLAGLEALFGVRSLAETAAWRGAVDEEAVAGVCLTCLESWRRRGGWGYILEGSPARDAGRPRIDVAAVSGALLASLPRLEPVLPALAALPGLSPEPTLELPTTQHHKSACL